MIVALAKWYLNLRPVTPADYYMNRKPLGRSFMEYKSECDPVEGFHFAFDLKLTGKDVLDLGCGFGGRTAYFAEMGAKSVTGVEVGADMVAETIAFARQRGVSVRASVGCGERLPFPDNSFDVITSYDVFEHVASLPDTLAECYRVLRPGGTLYGVFPPFYHPTGGAHLHGYVSSSPIPHLLFSCAVLRRAIELIQEERDMAYRPARRPADPLPTVNGTTVAQFFAILKNVPFSKKDVQLKPLNVGRLSFLRIILRVSTLLPLAREVCTSRIMCVLTK